MNNKGEHPPGQHQDWQGGKPSPETQVKDVEEARGGANAEKSFRDALPTAKQILELYQALSPEERTALEGAGFRVEVDLARIQKAGVLAAEEARKDYRKEQELAERMRVQETLAGWKGLLEFAKKLGELADVAPPEDVNRLNELAVGIPARVKLWEGMISQIYRHSVSMTAEKAAASIDSRNTWQTLHFDESGTRRASDYLHDQRLSRKTLTAILQGLGVIEQGQTFDGFVSEGVVFNPTSGYQEKIVAFPEAPGVELVYRKYQSNGYHSEQLLLHHSPITIVENLHQ